MDISPAKVAHVIQRAREVDVKVGAWDSPDDDGDADAILEMRSDDATAQELADFIAGLTEDEQTALVALVWIGRETFEPEEWDEAVATARDEATAPTEDYLMGIPLLADYLEAGLERMGIDPTESEDDLG
jgi:ABC-type sugar transport system substrate-binding protein